MKYKLLIITNFYAYNIGTIKDHLEAFKKFSKHDVALVDCRTVHILKINFDSFDAIILHYALVIAGDDYLDLKLRKKIADYKGYKILFIQDEYRWINKTAEAIRELGIKTMFTVVNRDVVDKIYHHSWLNKVEKISTLTGYVPECLKEKKVPSYLKRQIDVGYRGRRLRAWYGSFAQEKWLIGERFKTDAVNYGLICDIEYEEKNRIYGNKWIKFISNCKAVLGTESGVSICDFTGNIQRKVEAHEEEYSETPFERIKELYFSEIDGKILIHVISPRCFEAASLRTLMILYEGDYSGILKPWRHYVPLAKDHSNMNEVVGILKNPAKAQKIIDCAFSEVACNSELSYESFVRNFDRVVDKNLSNNKLLKQYQGFSLNYKWLEKSSWFAFYTVRAIRKIISIIYKIISIIYRYIVPKAYQETLKSWIKEKMRSTKSHLKNQNN